MKGCTDFRLRSWLPPRAEAKRVFEALSDSGKVIMPLQKTFWSEAFGMLVDRFGAPWMVNVMDPNQPG
jgi:PhnB protein